MTTCDDERCPILTPHRHEPAMTEPRPGVDLATSTSDVDLAAIRARLDAALAEPCQCAGHANAQIFYAHVRADVADLLAEVDRLRDDLADAERERDDARRAIAQLQASLDGAIRLNRVLGGDLPQGPLEQILAALSTGDGDPAEGDKR